MQLEILTPEKRIFSGEVEEATLLTGDGRIGVLSNHTPLVSAIKAGEMKIKFKGGEKTFGVENGVLETVNNKTIILLRKCVEK